jgi:hypothetical protein
MNESTISFDLTEDEILIHEVSDEALEVAARPREIPGRDVELGLAR